MIKPRELHDARRGFPSLPAPASVSAVVRTDKNILHGSSFNVPRCSRKLADTMATGKQFVNTFPSPCLSMAMLQVFFGKQLSRIKSVRGLLSETREPKNRVPSRLSKFGPCQTDPVFRASIVRAESSDERREVIQTQTG